MHFCDAASEVMVAWAGAHTYDVPMLVFKADMLTGPARDLRTITLFWFFFSARSSFFSLFVAML